jgi:hypothetical protein
MRPLGRDGLVNLEKGVNKINSQFYGSKEQDPTKN